MNEISMNGKATSPVDQKERIDIQFNELALNSC
jgi:hypothetical protein